MADNILTTFNKIMSSSEKSSQTSAFNPDEIELNESEINAASILALEGQAVNKYNVYLSRLVERGEITVNQAGHAAIAYEKDGTLLY